MVFFAENRDSVQINRDIAEIVRYPDLHGAERRAGGKIEAVVVDVFDGRLASEVVVVAWSVFILANPILVEGVEEPVRIQQTAVKLGDGRNTGCNTPYLVGRDDVRYYTIMKKNHNTSNRIGFFRSRLAVPFEKQKV